MADTLHTYKTGFSENKTIEMTPETLAQLKSTLLAMLKDFDKAALEHDIAYTLSGGSVLGALRHGGFIPWDDDLDINITRQNYNKLRRLFPQILGDDYILCTPEETPEHGMICAQIKKKGTIYRSFNELTKPDEICGICLDLFVVENTFDQPLLRKLQGLLCLAAGYLVTCRKTYHDLPVLEAYLKDGSAGQKGIRKKAAIGRLFSWISLDRITRWGSRVYALCKNDNSVYVTIPSGRGHFFKEMHKRTTLADRRKCKFEDCMTWVPKKAEDYCRKLYGNDFMTPPPLAKRESHPIMELRFDTKSEK